MEMTLSRKLRERANTRKNDERSDGHFREPGSENSEDHEELLFSNSLNNEENIFTAHEPEMPPKGEKVERKSTGGRVPRKQLACRPGDFHKRVRETCGNSNSESGP